MNYLQIWSMCRRVVAGQLMLHTCSRFIAPEMQAYTTGLLTQTGSVYMPHVICAPWSVWARST